MLADQWDELLYGYQKRNRINKTQQPQNHETCKPVGIPEREKFLENPLVVCHSGILLSSAQTNFNAQRSGTRALTLDVMRFNFVPLAPG